MPYEFRHSIKEFVGADDDLVMVSLEFVSHKTRIAQLVCLTLGECDGKSLDWRGHHAAHRGRDRGRVQTAGEKHPERHICHEAQAHALMEEVRPLTNEV